MDFTSACLAVFWLLPWSAPLRAALVYHPDPDRFPPSSLPPLAPRWLKPLCVQRWVGQAVAAHLAWRAAHPDRWPYRSGEDSLPEWQEGNLGRYVGRYLGGFAEAELRWLLGMEVERRRRLALLSPAERGEGAWVACMLAVHLHVAQVYRALRRRYRALRHPRDRARGTGLVCRRWGCGHGGISDQAKGRALGAPCSSLAPFASAPA